MLSINTYTANTRQTINPNDRCKLPGSRVCSTDWTRSQPKIYVITQNLCPSCTQFQNIHSLPKKISIYAKEFPAMYLACREFGYIFWATPKPVNVMSDSESVTRFIHTKLNLPIIRNACDFVLHFSFTIAHFPGKLNTIADSLSCLESDPS